MLNTLKIKFKNEIKNIKNEIKSNDIIDNIIGLLFIITMIVLIAILVKCYIHFFIIKDITAIIGCSMLLFIGLSICSCLS